MDGAIGASNPVCEVWNQAQLMWGPEPVGSKIKYLVSIGTGIPSLKPFRDNILHILEMCEIMLSAAESLVHHGKLRYNDDFSAIAAGLRQYI